MKTSDEILNYIFKLQSPREEEAFFQAMQEDEILYDVVDGMLDFCIAHQLTNKKEFEARWKQMKPGRDKLFREVDNFIINKYNNL